MDFPVVNSTPYTDSLLGSTNDLIMQQTSSSLSNYSGEEQLGGAQGKKAKKPSPKKDKKAPAEKKRVKEIDTFKKPQLEKIAKKHDVSLKGRDGKVKTKEQLFKSLKRKNLV
jgi:trimethylamine:corrinoid methyltransferase-like protein